MEGKRGLLGGEELGPLAFALVAGHVCRCFRPATYYGEYPK
jgi:hypothetical protein